ncbi:HAD family hydrolase [Romboutsia sp. 1001713B170131_170501_G6]|uniref:HAD family hydrolase n=1 Tax=Romboutsia sp. 1001713B170131_170501_G6 TaxID=2787108 RepID=UPI0018AAF735|nr:HAD family hydrolase [Romboutsia sp. 1001713B170131_170501_G6]
MIKYIFCDLDGTLYNGHIDDRDIYEINKVQEEGIVFNIATGRIFPHALNIIDNQIEIKGYYICENGSYIYNKDKELVFKGTIDDEIVRKVISRFESNDAKLYFKYNQTVILCEECNVFSKYTNNYILDKEFIHRKSFDNLIGNIGVVSDNIEELSKIEIDLKAEFNEILDIYFSSENTLNITPKNVSKRKGIEYICKSLGIKEDEIATIGDSPNDINMLSGVKYSFAMKNARDSVKEHANYIVDSVAEAIKIVNDINCK